MKKQLLTLLTVCAGMLLPNLEASDFELRINDAAGLDEPWPLIGGLPFPEGELFDAAQIRIVDGEGNDVPAQIDIAATWKDGSIRWAHAGILGNPNETYRVEFGPEVTRAEPEVPLKLEQKDDGGIKIDTGAAVYEFLPDHLLPESGRLGDTMVLSKSGDGAYLVDNQGRLARVAGEAAEVETDILIQGAGRAVIRRDGWYVTEDGEPVARARIWFYFTAGSPFIRMTHSIILTEDSNELWVRDYGLELRTSESPELALFGWEGSDSSNRVEATVDDDEVYLLQDTYPHFFDEESRAVVGRHGGDRFAELSVEDGLSEISFWHHDWLAAGDVAGDWADARFADFGLTVVTPDLAQRFPKEISVGPDGVKVVFWSARSGRELDLRPLTLVTEYWQDYADRAPGGPAGLAGEPTNAQGAARTHDVWFLPRLNPAESEDVILARAKAGSRPPLLQADPVWLTSTNAVGWEMHPQDFDNYADQEQLIADYWERLEKSRASRNFNGFIDWGRHNTIRGLGQFFRLTHLVDYGLRTHVWGLYARSGERTYYDYASGFNRFAGDWEMANWDTPDKFRGGFTLASSINLPFYWGDRTTHVVGVTGDDIGNWQLEYYLTGDAYAADRVHMQEEAFRKHWEQDDIPQYIQRSDGGFAIVRRLMRLYEWTWDEAFAEWAREWVSQLVDFDVPNAITDDIRHGPLYKTDRNLLYLIHYYQLTGDETARQAVLQALDYKYRFRRFRNAFAGQAYPALLYAQAYRWTGNPNYLRVVDYIARMGLEIETASIHHNMHPTMALAAGLALLDEIDEPIDPFPVVTWFNEPLGSLLMVRQSGDEPAAVLKCTVHMEEPFEEPVVEWFNWENGEAGTEALPGLVVHRELALQPSAGNRADPHAWYLRIELPEGAEEGLYMFDFPGARHVHVLESTAAQTSVYAPEGFRVPGDYLTDSFRVGEETETLRFFLGIPMTVYRPDGTVALDAESVEVGEQSLPVDGQAGVWSVRAVQSGVVRLFNAEPIFARSGQWLVTGAQAEPAPRFEPPTEDLAFVPGPEGQALHLPGSETLQYPRGDEVGDTFAHFPGSEGTVEFWFRPNWSSTDLAFPGGRSTRSLNFLRAGSHELQYRWGRDRGGDLASLTLWAHGEETNAGFTSPFQFEAGEWYHVAFVWKTTDGEPGIDGYYAIYVNGEPLEADPRRPGGQHGTAHDWPGRVNGALPFHRREADETILIGPVNGTLAQVRVSDTVRYTEPFTPADGPSELDEHTQVLFPLDGDKTGTTRDGETLELQK